MVAGLVQPSTIMNTSPISFPARPPELRLKRHTEVTMVKLNALQASLSESQRQLEADHEAMGEREAKIQAEEARLRQWQSQLEQGGAVATPPSSRAGSDSSIEAAWTKVYRTREILEEEQRHLNADRAALHAAALQLRDREAGLTAREARVSAAEQRIREIEESSAKKPSGLAGFTRSPFSFAKSAFTKS
jgi:chromosome segregation ATPase